MTRPVDDLSALCFEARRHEEPSAEDLAVVRDRLAAHIVASTIVAAGVGLSQKSTIATGATTSAGQALGSVASGGGQTVAAAAAKAWAWSGAATLVAGGGAASAIAVLAIHAAFSAPSGQVLTKPSAVAMPPPSVASASGSKASGVRPRAPHLAPSAAVPTLPAKRTATTERAAVATTRQGANRKIPQFTRAEPRHAATVLPRSTPRDLQREARALAEVQRALRDGRGAEALALLDQQARAFPAGSLAAERLAARALALCASGNVEAGRALGERFAREHSESPLAERVRRDCLAAGAHSSATSRKLP